MADEEKNEQQSILEEAGLGDNWKVVDTPPVNPNAVRPTGGPPETPAMQPYFTGSLPPTMQLDPDLVRTQYPSDNVPTTRLMPVGAAGNPNINAAIKSTVQPLLEGFGKKGSLSMPSIFSVGGDAPITATGNPIKVTLVPEAPWTFFAGPNVGISGVAALDVANGYSFQGSPATPPFTVGPLSPTAGTDFALLAANWLNNANLYNTVDTPAGWSVVQGNGLGPAAGFSKLVTSSTSVNLTVSGGTNGYDVEAVLALFKTSGVGTPTVRQIILGGTIAASPYPLVFPLPVLNGSVIIVVTAFNSDGSPRLTSITDTIGNSYGLVFAQLGGPNPFSAFEFVYMNATTGTTGPGSDTVNLNFSNVGHIGTGNAWAIEVTGLSGVVSAVPTFRHILNTDLQFAIFGPAGPTHAPGAVPDPGANAAIGTTNFLRADGTWDVPPGGANKVQATVNFTNPASSDGQDTTAQVVVTGQSWVTSSSVIVATIAGGTADHPDPDEPAVEDMICTVGDLVAGTGFTISVYTPNRTWGHYFVNCLGTS